jgi:hypothetical protein
MATGEATSEVPYGIPAQNSSALNHSSHHPSITGFDLKLVKAPFSPSLGFKANRYRRNTRASTTRTLPGPTDWPKTGDPGKETSAHHDGPAIHLFPAQDDFTTCRIKARPMALIS